MKNFPRCGMLPDVIQHASSMHSLLQYGMCPCSVVIYCWHWIVFLLDYERYYPIFTRCIFSKNFDISTILDVEFNLRWMMLDSSLHWIVINTVTFRCNMHYLEEILWKRYWHSGMGYTWSIGTHHSVKGDRESWKWPSSGGWKISRIKGGGTKRGDAPYWGLIYQMKIIFWRWINCHFR